MLFPLSQKDNHKQLNIQDKPLRHERTMTLKSKYAQFKQICAFGS